MNDSAYEKLLRKLNDLAMNMGSKADLMRAATSAEKERPKFYKALSKENIPRADAFIEWLENIGCQIIFPGEEVEEFSFVQKVAAKAGGGSSLVTSSAPRGMYAFRKDFLRTVGIQAENAVMMDVIGPSMEPLIMDGDTILVNEKDTELRDGSIFAVGYEDELLVKRLHKIPGGWALHSENPSYKDVEIKGEEVASLRVYGRVRWFGRVL